MDTRPWFCTGCNQEKTDREIYEVYTVHPPSTSRYYGLGLCTSCAGMDDFVDERWETL